MHITLSSALFVVLFTAILVPSTESWVVFDSRNDMLAMSSESDNQAVVVAAPEGFVDASGNPKSMKEAASGEGNEEKSSEESESHEEKQDDFLKIKETKDIKEEDSSVSSEGKTFKPDLIKKDSNVSTESEESDEANMNEIPNEERTPLPNTEPRMKKGEDNERK